MAFSTQLPRRLLLVKQMLNHGIEHGTKGAEFNRLSSILALDGAIENFLYIAIAELGGTLKASKQDTFYDVLSAANEAVIKATRQPLPLLGEMKALHEARNSAQHNALVPDPSTVQRHVVYSSDFLSQSFQLCFARSINEVSLADAVEDEGLRHLLIEAEKEGYKKNYERSVEKSASAFTKLKQKVRESEGRYGEMGQQIRYLTAKATRGMSSANISMNNLAEVFSGLISEIEYIDDRVETLSLGANIQEYIYFRKKAPQVALMLDGSLRINRTGESYSEHDCWRIFYFVYSLVLTWENSMHV